MCFSFVKNYLLFPCICKGLSLFQVFQLISCAWNFFVLCFDLSSLLKCSMAKLVDMIRSSRSSVNPSSDFLPSTQRKLFGIEFGTRFELG